MDCFFLLKTEGDSRIETRAVRPMPGFLLLKRVDPDAFIIGGAYDNMYNRTLFSRFCKQDR